MGESYSMKSKKRNEDARHRKDYLDGLKRFKKRGIPIIIDGKECREADWTRIFDVGEDGAFYMGDYVCSDKGGLKEIRFDKVYLSEDQKKKRNKERIKDKISDGQQIEKITISACKQIWLSTGYFLYRKWFQTV